MSHIFLEIIESLSNEKFWGDALKSYVEVELAQSND